MWFVVVSASACDIDKLVAGLPVLMWAYHPCGEHSDNPHYHFLLDWNYARADYFNPKIRILLLEPKTTSLKSSPCRENWPQDPSSLNKVVAYMKRFTTYTDVWEKATYWINPQVSTPITDVPPGFLKPLEMKKYLALKVQDTHLKTPPLVHVDYTTKVKRKPTQRDLIGHVWDIVQEKDGFDEMTRADQVRFVYNQFSSKLRIEKLKYDKYALIQMMNPILCEFVNGYNDSLKESVVGHFLSI